MKSLKRHKHRTKENRKRKTIKRPKKLYRKNRKSKSTIKKMIKRGGRNNWQYLSNNELNNARFHDWENVNPYTASSYAINATAKETVADTVERLSGFRKQTQGPTKEELALIKEAKNEAKKRFKNSPPSPSPRRNFGTDPNYRSVRSVTSNEIQKSSNEKLKKIRKKLHNQDPTFWNNPS